MSCILFLIIASTYPLNMSVSAQPQWSTRPLREEITHIEVFIDPHLPIEVESTLDKMNGQEYYTIMGSDWSQLVLQINYTTISETDRSDLVTYLTSIEDNSQDNGWTYNTTNSETGETGYQKTTGRGYDGDSTLNWIEDNLWNKKHNSHSLFLFNFTDLDRGLDHWFSIPGNFLDTDYTTTKSATGWGGYQDLPLYFLDLSSETYWGDVINANTDVYGNSARDIIYKIQDFNDTEVQLDWLDDTIANFVQNTYDQWLFTYSPTGKTVTVPIIAFYDWQDYGISMEDSQWTIQNEKMQEVLSSSFPWLDFTVTTQWLNLNDYPEIKSQMESETVWEDGVGALEIFPNFHSYITFDLLPQFIDTEGADIVLPSFVFLLDQTYLTSYGQPVSGIGDIGYQLQGFTPGARYLPNGTRKIGFSDVLLHEVGHSLGLPHPFSNRKWASDFVASAMSYFSDQYQFSLFDVNALGLHHGNYYLVQAETLINQSLLTPSLAADTSIFKQWYEEATEYQRQWNFELGIEKAIDALCGMESVMETGEDRIMDICADVNIDSTLNSSPSSSDPAAIPILVSVQGLLLLPIVMRPLKKQTVSNSLLR